MKTLVPTDTIQCYRDIFVANTFSHTLCDEVVEAYDKNSGLVYESGYGIENRLDKSHVDCQAINFHKNEALKPLAGRVGKEFIKFLNGIIEQFPDYGKGLEQCIRGGEDVRVKRYREGVGHFDWHTDNSSQGLSKRSISILAYFNTPEEGGETQFKIQDCEVKPEKGTIVAFPPNWTHPHRSKLVTKGNKYSCNIFLHM